MPTPPEWSKLLSAPRSLAADLARREVPEVPAAFGVYAWFRDEECVYVGVATYLRSRLSAHLASTPDLSRSTLRSWVAVRELGLDRTLTQLRPSQMQADELVELVNGV